MTFLRWELLRDNGNVLEILVEVREIYDVAFVTLDWRGWHRHDREISRLHLPSPTENERISHLTNRILPKVHREKSNRDRINGDTFPARIFGYNMIYHATSVTNSTALTSNIAERSFMCVITSHNVIGRDLLYYLIAF